MSCKKEKTSAFRKVITESLVLINIPFDLSSHHTFSILIVSTVHQSSGNTEGYHWLCDVFLENEFEHKLEYT